MLRQYAKLTHAVVDLVSAARSSEERVRDSFAPKKQREELICLAGWLDNRHYTAGMLSSVSLRLKVDKFLITAANADLSTVTQDDLCLGTIEPSRLAPDASLPPSTAWHRKAYHHPGIGCVAILQPASVLALYHQGRPLSRDVMPLASAQLGEVIHIPSDEAAELDEGAVTDAIARAGCIIAGGHGVVIWGVHARELQMKMQVLVRWAEVTLAISPNTTLAVTPHIG